MAMACPQWQPSCSSQLAANLRWERAAGVLSSVWMVLEWRVRVGDASGWRNRWDQQHHRLPPFVGSGVSPLRRPIYKKRGIYIIDDNN
uniref:Uncharacterized protein n=1 Tax=Oryza meridionalis TaxID=40149 RepID=A0A0E0DCY5_9ORYZ